MLMTAATVISMMTMDSAAKAPPLTMLDPYLDALRGHGREQDPLARLDMLRTLKAAVTDYESICVEAAREAGASWTEIGNATGQARQNAQRKWAHA